MQAGLSGLRKVSGVIFEKKLSARVKGKVYKAVIRPDMVYGFDSLALTKKTKLEVQS